MADIIIREFKEDNEIIVKYKTEYSVRVDNKQLTISKDKFIVVFKGDDCKDCLILHNNFIELKHNRFKHSLKNIKSKHSESQKFAYNAFGYFSSVIEAKVFVRSKRIELLKARLAHLSKPITTSEGTISADLHPPTVLKTKETKGELEKLNKWVVGVVVKHPEYFI